jgi:hypothetical protein
MIDSLTGYGFVMNPMEMGKNEEPKSDDNC